MPEFSQNIAVLVGINRYSGGISPLQSAVNDVEALSGQLQKEHAYQIIQLIDQQATRSALLHLFEEALPQQMQPDSRLLFYFAGHGIALNGDDGPQGYLIPQDAELGNVTTYLPMPVLQAALSKLSCRHFLGILDCCFAGAFRWSTTRKIVAVERDVLYQERYDRFIQDPAWQVITSAAYDQTASDAMAINPRRGQIGQHSPFAAALLEALSGEADIYPPARRNRPAGDGVITATELYMYLRDRVETATTQAYQRQTPGIWPLQRHDKGEYIFLSPGHPLNLPFAPKLDASQNPYRGLSAFNAHHRDLFFGRRELTQQLMERVKSHSLTAVVGASGSGKSSLVRAGLIPGLQEVPIAAQRWHSLPPLRLGEAPFESLYGAIAKDTRFTPFLENPISQSTPAKSEQSIQRAVEKSIALWCRAYPREALVIVIDQFEELITLCADENMRSQFLASLQSAIAHHPDQLRLVLTLRADFEPQFQSSVLSSQWDIARFVVPPMSRADLREAIVQPAAKRVIYFQSEDEKHSLVDQLIDEVADMPGALPLLSFTLSELYLNYLRRQSVAKTRGVLLERTITEEDYRAVGGVTHSLTQRADSEYQALVAHSPNYAGTIRKVMLRMVNSTGSRLSRRRVSLSELDYPAPEDRRVQQVIQQFSAARLIVEGKAADNQPYVEPAHEALISGWARLLQWQQEEAADLVLQRRLTPAAKEWRAYRRTSPDRNTAISAASMANQLDRGLFAIERRVSQLAQRLIRWVRVQFKREQIEDSAQPLAKQFLWNSSPYLDIFEDELQQKESRLNRLEAEFVRESLLQKRKTTSWRWRIAIAIILSLTGLTIATLIGRYSALVGQANSAVKSAQANFVSGQQLDAFTDSLTAAQILQKPLLQLFRPDQTLRTAAYGALQQAVYSVNEQNRLQPYRGSARSSSSADGDYFVSAGDDDTVTLWNWQGERQTQWRTGQNRILNLRISPDGQKVATAGGNGSTSLWSIEGQHMVTFVGHAGPVRGLSFSDDGRYLATASSDGTVRVWAIDESMQRTDASSTASPNTIRNPVSVLSGHRGEVWSVAFSPNGQQLASAASDGQLRLWAIEGELIRQVSSGQGELHTVRFAPDGRRLVTSGLSGTLRLWTADLSSVIRLSGHEGRVWDVVFSPDGRQLISASGDSSLRLWSREGDTLAVFDSHRGPVRNASFHPGGQQFVSSGDDGSLRIWDLQAYQPTAVQKNVQPDTQADLSTSVLSPDEQQVAIVGEDGVIRLRDSARNVEERLEGHIGLVRAVAFSPNGQQLGSVGQDGTVRLWNTSTYQQEAVFQVYSAAVTALTFDSDGRRLVTGDTAGNLQIWDLETQQLFAEWLAHPSAAIESVRFTANSEQYGTNTVVSVGGDGSSYLWPLPNLDALTEVGCDRLQNYIRHTEELSGLCP